MTGWFLTVPMRDPFFSNFHSVRIGVAASNVKVDVLLLGADISRPPPELREEKALVCPINTKAVSNSMAAVFNQATMVRFVLLSIPNGVHTPVCKRLKLQENEKNVFDVVKCNNITCFYEYRIYVRTYC